MSQINVSVLDSFFGVYTISAGYEGEEPFVIETRKGGAQRAMEESLKPAKGSVDAELYPRIEWRMDTPTLSASYVSGASNYKASKNKEAYKNEIVNYLLCNLIEECKAFGQLIESKINEYEHKTIEDMEKGSDAKISYKRSSCY